MASAPVKRLLIIGWDAADWLIIDPLFKKGQMPNLKGLVERGVRADLHTLQPKLSPLLWSTIATGKTADKHGILNFVEPDPAGEGVRVSASTSRRTKALWNMLTQRSKQVNVVGWYASHPAEPIRGAVVTNLFQEGEPANPGDAWPLQPGTVHPSTLGATLEPMRVHTRAVSAGQLEAVLPGARALSSDTRVRTLAKQLARMNSIHAAAKSVMTSGSWECMLVFYDAIDTIGHHFMQYRPPKMAVVSPTDVRTFGAVMDGVYRQHDAMLGELLHQAGEDTTVILLSDHGFYSDERRPVIKSSATPAERAALESSWHRPHGVLIMSGPGVKTGEHVVGATLLDITPTALALLGLPVGADMDGRPLKEALELPTAPEVIPSWDLEEGEAGLHPPDLRQDPFEARDAVNQLIELGYMPELGNDSKALLELTRRETQFNLAVVYMTTGRPTLAVPVLQPLAKDHPEESRYTLSLAQCLVASGRLNEATELLRALVARQRDSVEAQFVLAGALANAGQREEAASMVAALESAHASRRDLAIGLGDLCAAVHRWQDAERHYARAAQGDATNPLLHAGRARAALGRGDWEPAAEHALNALDLHPGLGEAHYLLGVALTRLDQLEHAATSFSLAVRWEPGLLDGYRYLALLSARQGDAKAALEHGERARALMDRARTEGVEMPPEALWGPSAWAKSIGVAEA